MAPNMISCKKIFKITSPILCLHRVKCLFRYDRRIPDIDELMRLPVTYKAGLRREEVIAVVLYTGPMVRLSVSLRLFILGVYGRLRCF